MLHKVSLAVLHKDMEVCYTRFQWLYCTKTWRYVTQGFVGCFAQGHGSTLHQVSLDVLHKDMEVFYTKFHWLLCTKTWKYVTPGFIGCLAQ